MSDVILGDKCRQNFGIMTKYSNDLDSTYKSYIDTLEQTMMAVTYSNDTTRTTITQTLILNSDDSSSFNYNNLENAIIRFCQIHNVALHIFRNAVSITITINMLLTFNITYETYGSNNNVIYSLT